MKITRKNNKIHFEGFEEYGVLTLGFYPNHIGIFSELLEEKMGRIHIELDSNGFLLNETPELVKLLRTRNAFEQSMIGPIKDENGLENWLILNSKRTISVYEECCLLNKVLMQNEKLYRVAY